MPETWITADGPVMAPSYDGPIRSSGPEGAFGVAAPETTFILNGGIEASYGVRMRPGDVITASRPKLVDYQERQGRLGLTLFTTTETTWTNQHGQMVKTIRGTGIRYWKGPGAATGNATYRAGPPWPPNGEPLKRFWTGQSALQDD